VLALRPLLRGVPRGVDALFAGAPRAELVVVMVALPLGMNLAQAWLQDAWLKARPRGAHGGPGAEPAGAEEGGGVELLLRKRRGSGGLDAVREASPSEESGGAPGVGDGDAEAEGAALLPRDERGSAG
jgi:hypothetical protein